MPNGNKIQLPNSWLLHWITSRKLQQQQQQKQKQNKTKQNKGNLPSIFLLKILSEKFCHFPASFGGHASNILSLCGSGIAPWMGSYPGLAAAPCRSLTSAKNTDTRSHSYLELLECSIPPWEKCV